MVDARKFSGRSTEDDLVHNSMQRSTAQEETRKNSPLKRGMPEEDPKAEDQWLERIPIAMVRSHNDPLFVNSLQRRIAECRTEDRCVTLVLIDVAPENEDDFLQLCATRENGLALWQQKLSNWLSDHPHVNQPRAFVTSDSELLITFIDIERAEATSILRQGLMEVLSGKKLDGLREDQLAKVSLPAKYHVGIASVASPSAGFTPYQLIGSTHRCYDAAKRTGSAAIKSIEVY